MENAATEFDGNSEAFMTAPLVGMGLVATAIFRGYFICRRDDQWLTGSSTMSGVVADKFREQTSVS